MPGLLQETCLGPPDFSGPSFFWADQEHLPAAHVFGRRDSSVSFPRLVLELGEFRTRELLTGFFGKWNPAFHNSL